MDLDFILPLIKSFPSELQKYAVLISTIIGILYHFINKKYEVAKESVACLFEFAVHMADADKTQIDKLSFAMNYVKSAFAKFSVFSFNYWIVRGMHDYQIAADLEVVLESKKSGMKNPINLLLRVRKI